MPHLQQGSPAAPRLTETVLTVRLRAAGCVFAEDEARLLVGSGATDEALAAMLDRRVAGFPLEHILGWVDFRGLRLEVGPGVFVPRQRSAFLVACAADVMTAGDRPGPLLRVRGARSGARGRRAGPAAARLGRLRGRRRPGAAQRRRLPGGALRGRPVRPVTRVPQGNRGHAALQHALCPLGARADLPAEARVHEPLVCLDGGEDGLEVQRRVAREALDWLAPGGHLLFEVGEDQEQECLRLLGDAGFDPWSRSLEEEGATVVIGRRPA